MLCAVVLIVFVRKIFEFEFYFWENMVLGW